MIEDTDGLITTDEVAEIATYLRTHRVVIAGRDAATHKLIRMEPYP